MEGSLSLQDLVPWITVALTAAILVLVWFRGKPTDAASAASGILEATETAKVLVMAAEQLWLTGKLPKDERLDFVLDQLGAQYTWLDADQARVTVEAAVFWLKQLPVGSKS